MKEKKIEDVLKDISQQLGEGKYSKALEASEKAIALNPGYAPAWVYKGIALKKMGRLEEALSVYNTALELDPADADTWYNRGLCIGAMESREKQGLAVESYRKVIELDPSYVDALYNLADVMAGIAQSSNDASVARDWYRQSEEAYDQAMAVAPDSPELYYSKGDLFAKQGRLQEALDLIERAAELNPGYAEAWYAKGYILGEMEKRSEALDAYRRAIALNPSSGLSVRAWINTGNVLGELGRPLEALEAYDKAIEIDTQRLRGVSSQLPGQRLVQQGRHPGEAGQREGSTAGL